MIIISQDQGRVQAPGAFSVLMIQRIIAGGDQTGHTHGSCHGVNTVLCPTQLIVKGTEYKH